MNKSVLTVTLNPALDKTVSVGGFEVGGTNRIRSVRMDAGGKGINVAKVLKGFEVDVIAFGMQAGHMGQVIRQKLHDRGINHRFLEASGETRTNLKVVDENTLITTELNEPGFQTGPKLLEELKEQFQKELEGAAIVVLSGSLPPGAPADFYKTLIQLAKDAGIPAILDADGEALARGVEAAPYAIKPNIHELEKLTGKTLAADEDIVRAAAGLIDAGIEKVIVSMGGDGSLLVERERVIKAKPFPIVPQSTVGAGDSMVAALAYSLLQGLTSEETARITSAAGTVTATKPGTEVCTLEEVRSKLQLVGIEHLSLGK